ncbi:FOLD2 [Scenedesmus sp. PABB004]|nr:FOLD2 [Scenedesmus sp. PABB004]
MAAEQQTASSSAPFVQDGVIDGKGVAAQIRAEVAATVAALRAKHGKVPGLAVVIVGERKDSQTYVRMKKRACEEVGIASFGADLPESASQAEVLALVASLNANPDVHGILVQLPLPKHIDEQLVLSAISVEKDVDGFHPLNMGRLCMKGREPLFVPCTPLGCIELLDRTGTAIAGARAAVIGRSNIVGMPVALLLVKRNATVTLCHSGTVGMEQIVRQADIVVAAAGQAEMIKGSWIKPGAVVIDVGTNPVDDASKKAGYRLVGDCAFEECRAVAGAITPVPGGVGPMTIALLLKNTLASAARFFEGECTHAAGGAAGGAAALPSWSTLALGSLATATALQALVRAWGRAPSSSRGGRG